MAVYLDFVYTDKRQKPALQLRPGCAGRGRGGQRRAGPGRAGKRRAAQGSSAEDGPILLDFSLAELGKESGAVRITDCEYLWDIMIDPSGLEKPTEARCNIRRLTSPPYLHALNPPNIDDVIIHEDGVQMYQMGAENLADLQDIWGAEPAEHENVFQLPPQIDMNQLVQIGEGQQIMNNNNDENQENQDPEGGDNDEEGDAAAAGDGPPPPAPDLNVWDALINDDLRQIGELFERKELIIEDYLE